MCGCCKVRCQLAVFTSNCQTCVFALMQFSLAYEGFKNSNIAVLALNAQKTFDQVERSCLLTWFGGEFRLLGQNAKRSPTCLCHHQQQQVCLHITAILLSHRSQTEQISKVCHLQSCNADVWVSTSMVFNLISQMCPN